MGADIHGRGTAVQPSPTKQARRSRWPVVGASTQSRSTSARVRWSDRRKQVAGCGCQCPWPMPRHSCKIKTGGAAVITEFNRYRTTTTLKSYNCVCIISKFFVHCMECAIQRQVHKLSSGRICPLVETTHHTLTMWHDTQYDRFA